MPIMMKSSARRWSLFFILSFLILLFLSPDSPLMHPFGCRCDSSWFFTAGKAWMEGMTPYVDFADSKGPLLWLIYGMGYLLSPTSYLGVFWLSVIAYTVTFAFVWKTTRLFVGTPDALLVLACMSALFFCRIYHTEVRAEDFCMPWISMSLYYACKALLTPSPKDTRRGGWWTGVSLICCLLIKWNYFFILGGAALIVAGMAFCKKSYETIVYGLMGMAAVALPFAIYFAVAGNFGAFVHEYFVNTFLITDNDYSSGMFTRLPGILLGGRFAVFKTILLLSTLLGMIAFCRRFRMTPWLLLAYVPFYLFLELKATGLHYCTTAVPFLVFLLIFAISKLSSSKRKIPSAAYAILALAVCVGGIGFNLRKDRLVFCKSADQDEWDAIQKIMASKDKPRILFSANDYGQGLLTRALPACKYWARQSGANSEMTSEREQAIRAGKPDFIFIMVQPNPQLRKLALECGYRQCHAPLPNPNGTTTPRALPIYRKDAIRETEIFPQESHIFCK